MLRLESGKHGGLVSKPVEAIRKDQQGGSPQPDKNAKALGMRLFLDTIAPEIPPDKNRKENREYPRLEKNRTEKTAHLWVHGTEYASESPAWLCGFCVS